MIKKLDIHSIHFEVDDNLRKYITKKINKLEKYIINEARDSLHVEVFMEEIKSQKDKKCQCEVVVHLPKEIIRIKEGTVNMYAAIDIVEEKLRIALLKYKDLHDPAKHDRDFLTKKEYEI